MYLHYGQLQKADHLLVQGHVVDHSPQFGVNAVNLKELLGFCSYKVRPGVGFKNFDAAPSARVVKNSQGALKWMNFSQAARNLAKKGPRCRGKTLVAVAAEG
jgi:hypothetical protein